MLELVLADIYFGSEKSCIVDFVTRFTHDLTPRNNFSCRNSYLYNKLKKVSDLPMVNFLLQNTQVTPCVRSL